jgi:hypothetical protein
VVYGCIVESEGEIERKQGTINLTGDPTASGFISFSELTEEVVLGWVKATLGDIEVTNFENRIKKILEARKEAKEYITEERGLPWS